MLGVVKRREDHKAANALVALLAIGGSVVGQHARGHAGARQSAPHVAVYPPRRRYKHDGGRGGRRGGRHAVDARAAAAAGRVHDLKPTLKQAARQLNDRLFDEPPARTNAATAVRPALLAQ